MKLTESPCTLHCPVALRLLFCLIVRFALNTHLTVKAGPLGSLGKGSSGEVAAL